MLGVHAGLDPQRELDLLGGIEQGCPGDLVEIHADQVTVGLEVGRAGRASPVGPVANDGTGGHACSLCWCCRGLGCLPPGGHDVRAPRGSHVTIQRTDSGQHSQVAQILPGMQYPARFIPDSERRVTARAPRVPFRDRFGAPRARPPPGTTPPAPGAFPRGPALPHRRTQVLRTKDAKSLSPQRTLGAGGWEGVSHAPDQQLAHHHRA